MNVKILSNLTDLSRPSCRVNDCQRMIADIKADTTMDPAASAEILSFADKVMASDTKMSQDALALAAKYSISENIDPAEPDDGEDDYY